MRWNVPGIILIGVGVLLLGRSPVVLAQAAACRDKPEDCKTGKTKACTVKVTLEQDPGGVCGATMLDGVNEKNKKENEDRHQVAACVGDQVTWEFENKCDGEVTVQVRNFRLDQKIADRVERELCERCPGGRSATQAANLSRGRAAERSVGREESVSSMGHECRDKDPFSGPTSTKVRTKKPARMSRRVVGQHYPRTYKYDIVVVGKDGKRSVLDPEAEIYR